MHAILVAFLLLLVCNGCISLGNIDTSEPVVIRSPSPDPNDGFGWTVIFHHLEPVLSNDSVSEVLRKTRLVGSLPSARYIFSLKSVRCFLLYECSTFCRMFCNSGIIADRLYCDSIAVIS